MRHLLNLGTCRVPRELTQLVKDAREKVLLKACLCEAQLLRLLRIHLVECGQLLFEHQSRHIECSFLVVFTKRALALMLWAFLLVAIIR